MGTQTVSLGSAGSITVVYDADDADFKKKTKGVEAGVEGIGKTITGNAVAFGKWAAAAVTAATAVGIAIFNSQSKVMDQLRRTADAMGEQQERLQALYHMAGLADVSAEGLAGSLDFLQRTLGNISDKGDPAAKALGRIGLSVDEIRAMSPIQQFEAIANGIDGLGLAADRASVRTALLGRGSKEMTDLLRELGQQGLDPTIAKLDEMGILLTRTQTQLVDNAGDAIFEAKAVLSGVAQQAVAAIAPFVQVMAEAFVDSAEDIDDWGGTVSTILDQVAVRGITVASRLRAPLGGLKDVLQDIWNGYQTLPTWAQEIGIVGAILGGKKGAALVALMSAAANDTKVTAQWFGAFTSGQISFGEWLTTGTVEGARQRLKEMGMLAEDFRAGGPSILQMLFQGSGDEQTPDEWADAAIAAYRSAINRVREQAATGAAAAEVAITPSTVDESPVFEHTKEENEKLLETIRERLMSKRELEEAGYEEERTRLYELLQQKTTSWEDYYTVQDQLAAEHQKKMQEIAEAERTATLSIYSNMFTNLSSLMNTGSRKLFAIGKAAAIANALIKGREAVVSSYAAGAKIGGPWLGAAFAATAAIATASQISQIRSASFDGGGSTGGAGSTYSGGIPSQATTPASSVGPVQPNRSIGVTLVGSNFTAQQVRDLIGQLNEQIGDGVTFASN